MVKQVGVVMLGVLLLLSDSARAQETEHFTALVTDSQEVKTEMKHMRLYWEEKVSETSFVPHEVTHVPVKRGAATVTIPFKKIHKIDVKPDGASPAKALSVLVIALRDGKTGEFPLALEASLIGMSDFGEIRVALKDLRTVVFK